MPKLGYKPIIPTQIPSHRYLICFPTYNGTPIMGNKPQPCGCSWTYSPDITKIRSAPWVIKFPYRHCRHYRMING